MLLQLDKFLDEHVKDGEKANLRTDVYGDVKKVIQCEGFVQVYFGNDEIKSFSRLEMDEHSVYRYSQGWLLNDEGKTIRRIF